ncbi:cAMP-regulated D2 protein-like [Solea senegalensis]|uniref:Carboxylic ester hydrolase n=1 Tax=Solea senegalensis TaxID=28829 RepID=A0AAV6QUE2_SOLSE|nr:cAMP-regulated D2 protein [Solea senegalensis]KAG7496360.1 cAMP-regulated D2 protein-like [Solea senegalensis]
MESWYYLLLCTLGLVLIYGKQTKNDDDIDLVRFLRTIHPGVLVRDEPFIINRQFRKNSLKDLERLGVSSVTEQSKDKPVSQDTNGTPGPVVLTKDGQIKGITVDKAHIFYGIPYADPPTGAYRWKPPRPVTPWPRVYDASFPRPACMQACRGPITEECPRKVSEDCLYLNIFIPLDVDLSSPLLSPLPVMVWIHGGDFIAGSASKPLYDGRFISNFTHTIVVSMEYRLGAFGFLVSGKDPHTSAIGNYGILDQQAAFLWVQRNIAVFGGDPSKVTIFGESAGAQSVSLHLMIQSSKPLFHQAVLQSLPFSIPLKTRHDALKLGKDFAKQTNCSVSDTICLLSLTSQAVLAAQMKTSSKIVNPFRFLEVFETWGPHIDGELIKEQAITAFLKGHWQKEKPMLLGTTSEEGVLFVYGVFTKPVSAVESTVYITAIFKQHALRVLHKYLHLYRDADRRDMLAQIVTDYVFLCPSRRSARAGIAVGSGVWMYVFDHVASDRRVWSGLTFCYQHACHGAELPFLFDSATVANFTMLPQEKLLSNRMLCYWGAFAHTGDPSSRAHQTSFCREQRLPVWPRYSDTSGWLVMNLTVHSHAQVGTRNHICDFWDQLGTY